MSHNLSSAAFADMLNSYKLRGVTRPLSMKLDVIYKRSRRTAQSPSGSRGTTPGTSFSMEGETTDEARTGKRRRMSSGSASEPPSSVISYSSYNEGHSSQSSFTSYSRGSSMEFSFDEYPSYNLPRGSGSTFWQPPMVAAQDSPSMLPSEDRPKFYFHPLVLPREEKLFSQYLHPSTVLAEGSSEEPMKSPQPNDAGNGSMQPDYVDANVNQ